MPLPYQAELISRAKALRREATPQERRLWDDFLRSYPLRFQRQKAILSYIVDFYCHAARLVIELDGDQHGEPDRLKYDAERTAALEKLGLHVLRFANADVDSSLDAVCFRINQAVKARLSPEEAASFHPPVTEYDP